MCLASFYPPGIMPDFDELCEGIQSNPDGAGYGIATNEGKLLVNKAVGTKETERRESKAKAGTYFTTSVMNVQACYDLAAEFCELRKEHLDTPAMFHSRFATGGAEDTRGCHPFAVDLDGSGPDEGTILIHNGVLFSPAHGDWRSDTRIFAEVVIRDVLKGTHNQSDARKRLLAKALPASPWSKNGVRKLESYLGGGNKIAIITVNPLNMSEKARNRGDLWEFRIYNAEQGIWTKEGAWHSNSAYMVPRKSAYRTYESTWEPGATWDYKTQSWTRAEAADEHGWANAADDWARGAPDTCGLGTQFREAEEAEKITALECMFCGQPAVSIDTLICGKCDTCQDCYEIAADCQCFTPQGAGKARTDDGWMPDWMARMVRDVGAKALTAGESDEGTLDPPAILSSEEKLAAWEAFQRGELKYGEYLEITCGESWGCACKGWCGESGCLPDDEISFEKPGKAEPFTPCVGDRVRLAPGEYPQGVSTVHQVMADRVTLRSESGKSAVTDTLANWERSGIQLVYRPDRSQPVTAEVIESRTEAPALTQAELDDVVESVAREALTRAAEAEEACN